MAEWHVCVPGGATVGPVTTSLLCKGIRHGKVPHDALACRVGQNVWRTIGEVPELAVALPRPEAFGKGELEARYAPIGKLGEGGMGEVYACADEWIGREVAMKVARNVEHLQDLHARFVREARLQGQLEHPAVVPVYDIGTRADGAVFFTMKRVRGLTLARIVDGLRRGDREISATYSRRRLLTAMGNVCLAVAFAHSRGVVHRDLKPENVMIGDFGEVYVLDWGLAKVLEDTWAPSSPTATAPAIGVEGAAQRTQAGNLMGTPGYAAPEQLRDEPAAIGPRTDVYALGAILFELVALEPLHRGATVEALVASTLSTERGLPSERAPRLGVPPELDQICARATALNLEQRFESARQLSEAIERLLDGERDEERRRELAERHNATAARELELAGHGGSEARTHLARGMQELGAALALDPTNEQTMATLKSVLLDAPAALPVEAEAELQEVDLHDRIRTARTACLVYSALIITGPLLFSMNVRRGVFLALFTLVHLLTIAYTWWMWKSGNAERRYMAWAVPLTFTLISMMSTIFGPLVLVPGAAAVNAAAFLVGLRANRETRLLILVAALAAVLVPAALQLAGIGPQSYVFEQGSIRIVSNLVEFRPIPAILLLTLGSLMTIVAAVYSVGRAVDTLVAADRRNFAQAWRLRQILPEPVTSAARSDVKVAA